ncbi:MAG TPA: DHA2 family efflux MFS transporter permease subunit [Pseudogracilibacillus sp.]|mgnify:FL=1|nr:DHA2 family efflux MFS transporter permease subunit [Pseudogracilibacillus sp.]
MDIKEIHKNPPYAMIGILFVGAFIAFLNNTLLNVALPSIMAEFSVPPAIVQWLTNGYMLVSGILVPASAFFIQRFTNRTIFFSAMSLFTVGTALAALSPSFGFLIAGRMTQAAGSALMMPLLMNVMLTAFPIERRGTAMGFFGLIMFAAPAIGPTLSGYIVQTYSWRMLFQMILPLAIIILILAIFKLKNITPNKRIKIDIFSLSLSTVAFSSLLYGFSSAGEQGWGDPIVYSTIIVGAVVLTIFTLRQLRMEEPMLQFRIFKFPMYALSAVILVVVSASMFSGMLLIPIYVQVVRDISPFHAGILMLPGAVLMSFMSPITGRLFDKYGGRVLAIIGLTITVTTTYLLSKLSLTSEYYYIMMLFTIRMLGMSLVMMPVMTNGLNQLPMSQNPHGTAMNNTLQQISGAIGSAVLITIMNGRMESTRLALLEEGAKVSEAQLEQIAMLDGVNLAFFVSTLIATVALFLAFFIRRVDPNESKLNEGKI